MAEKIVCIDGYSILSRAFYGIPELTNSQGVHTNAVYGFMNMMLKFLEEEKPQYLAVAFDMEAPTFRHEMYGGYKATRKHMPPELHEQVPLIRELLTACGIPIVGAEGFEADDILGTLAREAEEEGLEVVLVTGDRDLMQLATEHTCVRIPKTKGGGTVTENYRAADVKEKVGVSPAEYIDVKALMGDSSDNIPGVPGIGEKTAVRLIGQYGSLEGIRENLEEVRPPRAKKALQEHFDLAEMSRTLSAIRTDAPVTLDREAARLGDIFTREAYEVVSRLELKSLYRRFDLDSFGAEEKDGKRTVRPVTDPAQAAELLEELARADCVGLLPCGEGLALCAAGSPEVLSLRKEAFASKEDLIRSVDALAARVPCVAVLNWKAELKRWDFAPSGHYMDLGVASYLMNPLKNSYEMEDVARDCLGEMLPPDPPEIGAAILAEAAGKRTDDLKESGMLPLFTEIEMPLLFVLDRMEKAGVRVEREALEEYGHSLEEGIAKLEEEIHALAGKSFNIQSPKQLGEVLFEDLKLPYGKKTKTGYSTSADVLDKLKNEYPIAEKVLEYRTLTKLKSTYADGLTAVIREDGRIHGTFNQTVTATGRLSSTDPNLQNIPIRMELGRAIRKVFVPSEGCLFVDADYSQIELRILAELSGDANFIEAFRQGQDIHRMTASQVFHVPYEEVTPQLRRSAKAVNFGIVYGISAFGLSEDLGISRKEASQIIESYFAAYPDVKKYLDGLVEKGKRDGAVETYFGRRRPIPELSSKNYSQRSFGERAAMNSPIQGTAADIMKQAMVRVDDAFLREGLRARILLQVHDELVIEAPEEEVGRVREILDWGMTQAVPFEVPLAIEVGVGRSWYDTK